MICGELEEFVYIVRATKWMHKNFPVSCVCETGSLATTIGLRKVGQREKDLRLCKEYYTPTISFGLSKPGATASFSYQTELDETVFK